MNQESIKVGKAELPHDPALEAALDHGLADVQHGNVRSIEDVEIMIPQWTLKRIDGST